MCGDIPATPENIAIFNAAANEAMNKKGAFVFHMDVSLRIPEIRVSSTTYGFPLPLQVSETLHRVLNQNVEVRAALLDAVQKELAAAPPVSSENNPEVVG